jgi:hypothetical protein
MGVPQPTKKHRQDFYLYANWLYQVGVLVSRSSGPLFPTPPSNPWLWAASGLQAVFLCLFAVDAATRYWYSSSILVMCVLVGLLGGGADPCGTTPSMRRLLGGVALALTQWSILAQESTCMGSGACL